MGAPVLTPGEKVAALDEALAIIHGLWASPNLTYRGFHHQTSDATVSPRPVDPTPIWLGSYGPRS